MSRSTDLDDLDVLAAEVRATRPPRDPTMSRALDARVAEGFARPAATRRRPRRRWLAVAPAGIAALAVAAVLVARSGDGGTTDFISSGRPAPGLDQGAASSGSSASATAAPSSRLVARDASLVLRTSPRELQDDADAIVATTERAGGYVSSSRVDARASGGEASFVLRVPTDRLARTLTQLGRIAAVQRLDQGSEDVTNRVDASASRLDDARQERDVLLRALADAEDRGRIAELRARLADARRLVARRTADLAEVRGRVRTARVDVDLTASRAGATVAPPRGDGRLDAGEALRVAGRVLGVAGAVALLALLLLAPPAALGAGAVALTRALRRRGRERALRAG